MTQKNILLLTYFYRIVYIASKLDKKFTDLHTKVAKYMLSALST